MPTAISEGIQSLELGFAIFAELPQILSSAGSSAQAGDLFSAALSLVSDELSLFGDLMLGLQASLQGPGQSQSAGLPAAISSLVSDIEANPLVNGGKNS